MMSRKKIIGFIAAMACVAGSGMGVPTLAKASTETPQNVVLVLIDDMGWKDLGSYGGEVFETPNINKLAAEGMLFTDAYASCSICAPTRASLITGRYPGRLHFTALTNHHKQLGNVEANPTGIKLIQPEITQEDGVQPSEYTIGRAFREAGYRTALFGKTHFGSGRHNPSALGFDEHEEPRCDMWITPPAVVEKDPKRMTTITDRSIEFMRESKRRGKPFFLYVSHNAVHVQVQATQDAYIEAAERMTKEDKGVYDIHYVAMVNELDQEMGRLFDEMDRLGVANNTAVIFASDNGGVEEVVTSDPYKLTTNAPLRGQKGGQYEGSHRVPLIVKWPGMIEPGSVSNEVTITTDFYPTFLEMAGLPLQPQQHLDGISIAPALRGGTLDRDAVYWHKPHYYSRNPPLSAVRSGRYKYILYWETELSPAGGRPHELFDLEADIGETNNLVDEKPEVAARLHQLLLRHVEESGCEIPKVNPQYVYSVPGFKKWSDFEQYIAGQVLANSAGVSDPLAKVGFKVDGSGNLLNPRSIPVGKIALDTWYNAWLVVDHRGTGAGSSASLYLQSADDANLSKQTLVADSFYNNPGTSPYDTLLIESERRLPRLRGHARRQLLHFPRRRRDLWRSRVIPPFASGHLTDKV